MHISGLPLPPLPVSGPLKPVPRRERAQQHQLSQNEPSATQLAAWQADHARAMAPTLAALRTPEARALQPNGEVQLINTYPHGLVYVPNRHQSNGLQVLGKLYCLWFDAAHRPYTFSGKLSRQYRVSGSGDVATRWQERFAHRGTEDANMIALRRAAVDQTAELLREGLAALKGAKYPNADQFLHALHDHMLQAFIDCSDEPMTGEDLHDASVGFYDAVLRDCYADLMHCNEANPVEHREMWPVVDQEHEQLRLDQKIGLYVDNRARTGDPFSTHLLDHAPWYPNVPHKETPNALGRRVIRKLRVKAQPVSHEAVRRAFAGLVQGANYWDERLQRGEAVPAVEVAAKERDWQVAYAAYNEQVRARALAALAEPLRVADPALQAQIDAQRAAQADSIRATPAFPVFANAPWRVAADEVEALRDQHFVMFKAVPKKGARPMEGNCNSGVFFLLRRAALEQQRLEGSPTPPEINGGHGWRTYGAATDINIPHPDALPEAPSFT